MEAGFIILIVLVAPILIIWPMIIWANALRGIFKLIFRKPRSQAVVSQGELQAEYTSEP